MTIMSKYEKWYNELIAKALSRSWTRQDAPCYTEKHHIVPRSLGGSNNSNNLVLLTAREHFIAHRLLCKYGDSNQQTRMIHAMQKFLYSMKDRSHINSRTYNHLRSIISNVKKESMINNKHRLGVLHSDDIKQKMSEQRKGVAKSESTKQKMSESAKKSWLNRDIVECPHCGKTSRNKSSMTRYHFKNCRDYHGS